MNLVKYSSKFLAHVKERLGYTGTPTNVQNNYIKLPGFSVDITKFLLHWQIMKNILCRENKLNPKILSQVFRTNLTYFLRYLCRFISG